MLSPGELLMEDEGIFTTSDGQCAWRKSHLTEVMNRLVSRRYAVLSGEVWVVEGNLFSSLSPRKDGGWAVFSWDVPSKEAGESWEQYAHRASIETMNAIRGLNAEDEVAPEASGNLYYFLCIADETEYNHLASMSVWQATVQQIPMAM